MSFEIGLGDKKISGCFQIHWFEFYYTVTTLRLQPLNKFTESWFRDLFTCSFTWFQITWLFISPLFTSCWFPPWRWLRTVIFVTTLATYGMVVMCLRSTFSIIWVTISEIRSMHILTCIHSLATHLKLSIRLLIPITSIPNFQKAGTLRIKNLKTLIRRPEYNYLVRLTSYKFSSLSTFIIWWCLASPARQLWLIIWTLVVVLLRVLLLILLLLIILLLIILLIVVVIGINRIIILWSTGRCFESKIQSSCFQFQSFVIQIKGTAWSCRSCCCCRSCCRSCRRSCCRSRCSSCRFFSSSGSRRCSSGLFWSFCSWRSTWACAWWSIWRSWFLHSIWSGWTVSVSSIEPWSSHYRSCQASISSVIIVVIVVIVIVVVVVIVVIVFDIVTCFFTICYRLKIQNN